MTVFASHKVWIIVDHLDHPLNDWEIFSNPSTTFQTFTSQRAAEHKLSLLKTRRKHYFEKTRTVEATVSWETHREEHQDE